MPVMSVAAVLATTLPASAAHPGLNAGINFATLPGMPNLIQSAFEWDILAARSGDLAVATALWKASCLARANSPKRLANSLQEARGYGRDRAERRSPMNLQSQALSRDGILAQPIHPPVGGLRRVQKFLTITLSRPTASPVFSLALLVLFWGGAGRLISPFRLPPRTSNFAQVPEAPQISQSPGATLRRVSLLARHRPRASDPPRMKLADSLDPSAQVNYFLSSRA